MRMSLSSVIPAGSNRVLVYFSTKVRSGTPCWSPMLTAIAKESMIPARVEPCFETFMNTSPGRPSSPSPVRGPPGRARKRSP